MHGGQFKDPLSYPFLVGSVGSPWSLTQEVACSNTIFVTEFAEFSENI